MSGSTRAFAFTGVVRVIENAADKLALARETGSQKTASAPAPSRWRRWRESDLVYSFLRSKLVVLAAIVTVLLVGAAFLAPVIAPHNPYDLKSLSLLDSNLPPMWEQGGEASYPLGTDDQGDRKSVV